MAQINLNEIEQSKPLVVMHNYLKNNPVIDIKPMKAPARYGKIKQK